MPNCSVPGCKGESGFQFPTDPEMRMKWQIAIRRKDHQNSLWTPSGTSIVCDAHFKLEDFKETLVSQVSAGYGQKRRRVLKPDAVPSLYGPKVRIGNQIVIPMTKYTPLVVSLGSKDEEAKEFIIDEVTFIRHNLHEIHIKCWHCGLILEDASKLQNHLNQKHGDSLCPGKRCGGFLIAQGLGPNLLAHLQKHHYNTLCPKGHVVSLPELSTHLLNACKDETGLVELRRNSISFSSDEVPIKKVMGNKGNYYLDGELCTVDGIHYCILEKDFSIIVDCPLCKQAIGLILLGSHIIEDHSISDTVACLSPECSDKKFRPELLSRHIIEEHTSLRCKECKWPLTIVEVQQHFKYRCPSRIKDNGPKLPRQYPTITCPYCSNEVLYLNDHIKKKHIPRDKCFICQKWIRKSKLIDHMSKNHSDNKELYYKKCCICDVEVIKLESHMKAMHDENHKTAVKKARTDKFESTQID